MILSNGSFFSSETTSGGKLPSRLFHIQLEVTLQQYFFSAFWSRLCPLWVKSGRSPPDQPNVRFAPKADISGSKKALRLINSALPKSRTGTPHYQGLTNAGRDGRHPVQRVRREGYEGSSRFGRCVYLT